MREVISFSMGKNSNFASTHFWNAQDEQLKVPPTEGDNEEAYSTSAMERVNTLYQEQQTSGQLVARHIYVDFRDNFGNYSSCFQGQGKAGPGGEQPAVDDIIQSGASDFWAGGGTQKMVTASVEMSKFQRELLRLDSLYQKQEKYEAGLDEEEDNGDEEAENQDRNADYDDEDYDDEHDRRRGKGGRPNFQGAQGSENMQDVFANFFKVEQEKYEQTGGEEAAEEKQKQKADKKEEYEQTQKELDELQDMQPHEFYDHYDFEHEVRYFTDFMQSQMFQKYNQLVVPHNNLSQDSFQFFNKGRELWSVESDFKEDMEDKIRLQLEMADMLQGFQLTIDGNSGFASLGKQMITYFLKDEAPKAPVFIFCLNNQNKFDMVTEDAKKNMNGEEVINLGMMRQLGALNKSLFFSEFDENVDLVLPFDQISIGSGLQKYFGGFRHESLFHRSSLPPLVTQSLNNILLDRQQQVDMKEMLRSSLYQGAAVNILTPQIQLPIQHMVGDRYLEKIKKEHLSESGYFVSFTARTPLSERRLPLRHTFVLQGANALVGSKENPRVFKEQFDAFIFQNTRFERGLQTHVLADSHLMAIPYPRYFTESRISSTGLLLPPPISPDDPLPPAEFLQSVPCMTKLLLDGSYLGEVERMHKALKGVRLAVRASLLKENDNMEEDEWREKVYQLESLLEAYRSMALSGEPSDEEEEDDDDFY